MKSIQMLVLIVVTALLSACAGISSLETAVAKDGAAAADNALQVAEFAMCRGITVGAWVRRYGNSADSAAAWRTLCASSITQTPTDPAR